MSDGRDHGRRGWARPVNHLHLREVPAGAINLNVEGQRLSGLVRGFGQMWQKTYRLRLSGIEVRPTEVIQEWKSRFPSFWPAGADLYVSLTGIQPGEVGLINISTRGLRLSTGILVIYADEESFSFMTPEGHMFAGMITFSAEEEDEGTIAQIQALIRAHDPLYELSLRLGFLHKMEDDFWRQTLRNLGNHFGVSNPHVIQTNTLVDSRVQWSEARNIFQNAGIRSSLMMPILFLKRVFNLR